MITGSEFHKGPEICSKKFPYDGEKADVFSLAVVLFTMQMANYPFGKVSEVIYSKQYKHYVDGNFERFWPEYPAVSDEFKDLIHRMIARNPDDRLTLQQVRSHPWT
jgi:serine/threonine protein kinase